LLAFLTGPLVCIDTALKLRVTRSSTGESSVRGDGGLSKTMPVAIALILFGWVAACGSDVLCPSETSGTSCIPVSQLGHPPDVPGGDQQSAIHSINQAADYDGGSTDRSEEDALKRDITQDTNGDGPWTHDGRSSSTTNGLDSTYVDLGHKADIHPLPMLTGLHGVTLDAQRQFKPHQIHGVTTVTPLALPVDRRASV
jgi:hypothetical protein